MTEEVKEQSFQFFDYHMQDIVGIYKERAIERQERKRQEELKKEMIENGEQESEEEDDDYAQELLVLQRHIEGQFDSINKQAGKSILRKSTSFSNQGALDTVAPSVRRLSVTSRNQKSEKLRNIKRPNFLMISRGIIKRLLRIHCMNKGLSMIILPLSILYS
jgi:hypothetical protein